LADSAVKKTDVSAGADVSTVAYRDVALRGAWAGEKALVDDNDMAENAMVATAVENFMVE